MSSESHRNIHWFFLAALLLRSVLLWARGPFLEFDETFYMLIARNLTSGAGYVMNGLPQIAFPPLPALIYAGLGMLIQDLVLTTRVVSAFLGAALVFPVSAMARRTFGNAQGDLAAALVVVMPTLMTFVPVDRTYAQSLYFGPEPIYVFLFATAGWLLARAIAGSGLLDGLLCGCFAGMTYLTRNEALAFIPAAALVLVLACRRRLAVTLAFTCAAALVALPYPAYLHSVTGRWSASGKTGSAVLIRESIVDKVRDNDPAAFEALHYGLNESNTAMVSTYWGYRPESGSTSGAESDLLQISWSGAVENIGVYVTTLLPTLYPPALWPLVAIGLGSLLLKLRSGKPLPAAQAGALLAMGAMLVPSIAVCLFLFVEPRHHLYLVIPLIVLSAHGLVIVLQWISRFSSFAARLAAIALILGLLLATLSQLRAPRPGGGDRAYMELVKSMGAELDATLDPSEPIMSWHPAIAFYANRPWCVMPTAGPRRIASYALRRGSRVIIYETSVHGPPPGADASTPFTLVRLTDTDPDRVERQGVAFVMTGDDTLYREYDLGIAPERR